jgi:PIN domain nuclease of toxin-antitoxin system
MILLDTHIWIWWVDGNPKLPNEYLEIIHEHQNIGIGVSIYSCWEIAKLVEYGKLEFTVPVEEWLQIALSNSSVQLLDLTIPIIVQSTRLLGFHKDPADQIIVATAKILNISLLTADSKILEYPDVVTISRV